MKPVAQKNMKIVQPMLNALRSGDPKKIAQYSDVISTWIDDVKNTHDEFVELDEPKQSRKKAGERVIADYLQEMGIPPEMAEKYARRVMKENPKEEPMRLVRRALSLYDSDESKKAEAADAVPEKGGKKKNATRETAANVAKSSDADDLRNADSYEGMKEKGGENE